MKKVVWILAALLMALSVQAGITTGDLNPNPFMSGGDYSGWGIGSPWRDNGANDNLVFDINNSNSGGFPSAFIAGKNLTTEANVTALENYDSATTKLTGLSFGDVWLQTFGDAPADGSYKFFVEFDLVTSTGGGTTYTAKSQEIAAPWTVSGSQALAMSWNENPFADGGVALGDIVSSAYKVFMYVETPTTDASTTYFTADNFSTTYTVESIPEPATLGLIGLSAVVLMAVRRMARA